MIEYVFPHNIDDRVLAHAQSLLADGKLISFPTDTNWVVACDPFHKKGVEALYRFKGEEKSKHFSLVIENISKASDVAVISDFSYGLIRKRVPGHYTFIFEATKKITKALKASKTDRQVGIRIPPSPLALALTEVHGEGLLTTQIEPRHLCLNQGDALYSYLIEEKLGHLLSLIIDPGEYEFAGPSSVVSFLEEGAPEIIREGAGDTSFFG